MRQTLAFVGGVPNRGIEYMRVHYMLDLVTASAFGTYDWSRLDAAIDVQIGWHLYHTWHGMPYFAGLAAKIVDQHQRLMIDSEGIDYEVLSNDNGFVGHWRHRMHLTYFGKRPVRAAQAEHKTDIAALEARRAEPEPFDLVKKPALSILELLGLLSERRFDLGGQGLDPDRSGLGAIATALGGTAQPSGASVLLYNSVDRIWQSGESTVALDVSGLQPGAYALASFRIAHGKGDPFTVWEDLGAPDLPNAAELAAMRLAQEPALSVEHLQIGGATAQYELKLDMPLPSVALVALIRRDDAAPAAPSAPRINRFGGLNGESRV
eukprot:gene33175-42626_t